jgi:hypothetical protein
MSVGKRSYLLIAIGPIYDPPTGKEITDFFDSFTLLRQEAHQLLMKVSRLAILATPRFLSRRKEIRKNYVCLETILRKIFRIQGDDEIGFPLFRAKTERVVVWIG